MPKLKYKSGRKIPKLSKFLLMLRYSTEMFSLLSLPKNSYTILAIYKEYMDSLDTLT